MWAAIKKAINSNLAKPLNVLLGELYNSHKTDIGNTYNKAYEANDNALKSLQKGQEIVNMLNDTGGKRYTVVRQGTLNGGRFDYSGGAGILRSLYANAPSGGYNYPSLYVDGVSVALDWASAEVRGDVKVYLPYEIEFKSSISIIYGTSYPNMSFIVQTER